MSILESQRVECTPPGESGCDGAILEARTLLANNEAKCVVIKNNNIIAKYIGMGLRPILEIYRNHPEAMRDGVIVDTVIGRAAAFVIINGGAKRVYSLLMSSSAKELLEEHNIQIEYDQLIPEVFNRDRTDLCPLERCVLGESSPTAAMEKIYKQIEILMSNKI